MRTRATFRETLWFKQGEAAVAAPAPEATPDDAAAPARADLPLEDRYLDDGSVTPYDSATYGVHIGTTRQVAVISLPALPGDGEELAVVAAELGRVARAKLALAGLGAIGVVALAIAAL